MEIQVLDVEKNFESDGFVAHICVDKERAIRESTG